MINALEAEKVPNDDCENTTFKAINDVVRVEMTTIGSNSTGNETEGNKELLHHTHFQEMCM